MSLNDALATRPMRDVPSWFTHEGHADFLWHKRSLRSRPPKTITVPVIEPIRDTIAVTDNDFSELIDSLF